MSDCRKLLCIITSNRPWMSLHVSRDVYFLQVSSALTLLFLFVDNEALKISVWQEAAVIAAQICPFPECNVLIIRKAWNWLKKKKLLLACPPSPDHNNAFTVLRWWVTIRCSISPGQQGEPRANEAEKWQRTFRAYSVCCFVVPLRDLDLVTAFNAASFCVAFFSSSLYIEKLIHLVNVMTYDNASK